MLKQTPKTAVAIPSPPLVEKKPSPRKRPTKRGRRRGSRNADYAAKRNALARAMLPVVVGNDAVSLQKLANAADVSVPTLRHYFDDREGAVAAAMEVLAHQAAPHVGRLRNTNGPSLEATLLSAMQQFVAGWRDFGVGHAITRCLSLGLLEEETKEGEGQVGPAVVNFVLEPTIDALERLLERLQEEGTIDESADLRLAALTLLSPVLVALLHQDGLHGVTCRPLDVDAFVQAHVSRFMRGYGSVAASTSAR